MASLESTKGRVALPLAGLICLVGAWTVSAAAPFQDRAATGNSAGQEQVEEEHTPLQLTMKTMYRGTKALRPMLRDFEANQAAVIKVLASMEAAMIESLSYAPPRPEGEMSDTLWAQYEITFHQELNHSLGVLLAMKLAAHKGEADAVIEGARSLNKGKKEGHGTYKLD